MRFHRFRYLALGLMAAILVLPGLLAVAPRAGAQEACFPETGQCVQEPFLTYWRTHGGLAIHGYPLSTASPEQLEDGKTYTVQYFERSRFELHPENAGTPFEVLLGQFGRLLYLTDPGQPLASAAAPLPGATYFNATGHNLRGGFLAYWEANGGLAQFGYPISEELRERLENGQEYTVQYFERARFARDYRRRAAELNGKIDQYNLIVPARHLEKVTRSIEGDLRDADRRRWAAMDAADAAEGR